MADEQDFVHMQDFVHIKVNSKVSPDELIYAGLSEAREETLAQNAASSAPELASNIPQDLWQAASQDLSQATSQAASPVQSASSGSTRTTHRSGTYHETTMADLQDTHVSLTQKVVIVAAILLIIVALAYYAIALR